jgi:hypothetical protein
MEKNKEETHPSWVTVQFNRVSGQRTFFGSAIESTSWITLNVSVARRGCGFGQDRIMGEMRGDLIEVALSPAQFAELLTTMNVGTGVPGTMTRFDGKKIEDYEEKNHEATRVKEFFKERVMEKSEEIDKSIKEILNMLTDKKKNLTAANWENIWNLLDMIRREYKSNIPFYISQFEESSQKIVTQAKAEVDAFVMNAVVNTGIAALKENSPKLLSNSEHQQI